MLPSTVLQISSIPTGLQALHHAILPDGTLAVAATEADLASEWARIFASDGPADPPSQIDQLTKSGHVHLLIWGEDDWRYGPTIPDLPPPSGPV